MGIAPIVPAHRIKEIIMQKELLDMMKKVDAEISAENQKEQARLRRWQELSHSHKLILRLP